MDKTLAVILMIVCLAVGIVGTVAFIPDAEVCKKCVETVCPEPEVLECAEPEVTVCENTAEDLLNVAVDDLLGYLDDEDELECDAEEYDLDEVTVRKVYDEFNIEYDDDEFTVEGEVKLNFKQDDEKRCRETVNFEVFYEDDEDPIVTIV